MLDFINCMQCGTHVADFIDDEIFPDFETLRKQGAIPVPNAGWLCSEKCALDFEKANSVTFQRNKYGKIDYYDN